MSRNHYAKRAGTISAIVTALMFGFASGDRAHALTGDDILTKLDTDAQYQYITGVLEGLGYARFLKDKPDQTGIKCIQTWFNDNPTERWDIVKQWLEQHKEKPVGVIVYAMVSKDCGR